MVAQIIPFWVINQAELKEESGVIEAALYKYLWSSSVLLTSGHGPGKQ